MDRTSILPGSRKTLCRCVADVLFQEVSSHDTGPALPATQEAPNVAHQVGQGPGPRSSHGVGLHILVEDFVGVQVKALTLPGMNPRDS